VNVIKLVSPKSFVSTNWRSNKHILCITMWDNNNPNQITDISTLQFLRKLHNFVHVISMQSNGAGITLSGSGSGRIYRRISGHIRFRPNFKNLNTVNH